MSKIPSQTGTNAADAVSMQADAEPVIFGRRAPRLHPAPFRTGLVRRYLTVTPEIKNGTPARHPRDLMLRTPKK